LRVEEGRCSGTSSEREYIRLGWRNELELSAREEVNGEIEQLEGEKLMA